MATINNGNQQVSIFPYQELDSALGNSILYGILEPGVYASSVLIEEYSPTQVKVVVGAGTVCVFFRTDNQSPSNKFVGKVVLTSDAEIILDKDTIWEGGGYSTSSKLYVTATWTYDITAPSEKYASFEVKTDATVGTLPYNLSSSSHSLLIATLLNHQYFTNAYPANPSPNLSNYHIAYDNQTNRNLYNKLNYLNNEFQVNFSPEGTGVYVTGGNVFISGSTFNPTSVSAFLTEPLGVTYTIPSKVDGSVVNVTSPDTTADYYQVDFLRIKRNENTGNFGFVFDSFITPKGSLDFDTYIINKNDLRVYLSTYEYPLSGDGKTILVLIRPRNALTNRFWPENTIIINEGEEPLMVEGSPKYHDRFKIPVYTSSDLGY